MILQAFSWYIILTVLGWVSFPIAFTVFSNLRDRGYGLSRVLGLLLWGYIFWLSTSLNFSRNNLAGISFAGLLLILISLQILKKQGFSSFKIWYQENHQQVWIIEILFAAAFALITIVRAANPEALGTEKPMELAFINAILHSETFPPHDPWLSGYGISYYYFGYILVAMLAKISATPGGVAFNLGISTIFALSAISSYSLLANLLSARFKKVFLWRPMLAPLMALCVGNIEGFLEVLHSAGLFWQVRNGQWVSSFWKWMDLVELTNPPQTPFTGLPSRWYWWWRASRVIQDYDLTGGLREVIDEFPAFSYILADLHPHVLAMPFAFLAMAIALNLYFKPDVEKVNSGAYPLVAKTRWFTIRYPLSIPIGSSFLIALILGSLAFLNTWDFPIYVAFCALAYSLWHLKTNSDHSLHTTTSPWSVILNLLKPLLLFGIWEGFWGAIFYMPFYLGFSSQAGGILPNLIYPSRGAQLWVMFAPLWIPIFSWIGYLLYKNKPSLRFGSSLAFGFFFTLWVLSIGLGLFISLIPQINDLFLGSIAAPNIRSWLIGGIERRFLYTGGWLTLVLLLAFVLALLFHSFQQGKSSLNQIEGSRIEPSSKFVLFIILTGTILVLIPDFFFLRDQFGWRINTVFKFYYQAWLFWSIAAAYAIAVFPSLSSKAWRIILITLSFVGISLGLIYTFLATLNKTNGFNPPQGWTLDSSAYYQDQSYEEMQVIHWLSEQPLGVVAEAVSPTGGSYTQYARVSTFSGQPAVLGWTGHESQWRGGASEMGSRQSDLINLYCSNDWMETFAIIQKYSIKYIFVGDLEWNTYSRGSENCPTGLDETKFQNNLIPVYQQGTSIIYLVP